ncbi:GNAT family N-acetyltransferase/peptidase C39 family protein [Celerinatantimonas sp. YJH-8]|uniref:GNAT family N-acetyltransferase/peptidase C39 family protein n=1 Tax=Celerinatantimonas sp. YJH-8 TaxID=3228714 RepID=UPI0038C66B84
MTTSIHLEPATTAHLNALLNIEYQCFESDRISKRSFQRFIHSSHADLQIAIHEGKCVGYALVLYRRGTSLARLYSLAVLSQVQHQGVGLALVKRIQNNAQLYGCHFLRLEVDCNNQAAIHLYQKLGFHEIDTLPGYYENGNDGLRMEKPLQRSAPDYPSRPYYAQTTPFTCGPASLMMAMQALDATHLMTRQQELQIWREATTIYMTSGHGGCAAEGLALAAWRRGFQVSLFTNTVETPFIDGVRSEDKKSVLKLVHQTFCEELAQTDVNIYHQALDVNSLFQYLTQGAVALTLVSTWRLNRNKAPHWVMVAHADTQHLYLNDPDFDTDRRLTPTDLIQMPITPEEFRAISQFGRSRMQASIVIQCSPKKSVAHSTRAVDLS